MHLQTTVALHAHAESNAVALDEVLHERLVTGNSGLWVLVQEGLEMRDEVLGAHEGLVAAPVTVGGVAADVGVDLGSLTLDARYSLGLSKLNKDLGQKANIFSVAVGFKFQ